MAKFIRQRERVEVPRFSHEWHYTNDPGAGYYVPCSKEGNITPETAYTPSHYTYDLELYQQLMAGFDRDNKEVVYDGIVDRTSYYTEPAAIECDVCKGEVSLERSMTNDCEKCGAEYNSFGQRLADRSQWGEETNERWYDIPNDYLY
jgi:hypothetical protein